LHTKNSHFLNKCQNTYQNSNRRLTPLRPFRNTLLEIIGLILFTAHSDVHLIATNYCYNMTRNIVDNTDPKIWETEWGAERKDDRSQHRLPSTSAWYEPKLRIC
jgi:hypothetical protein